MTADAAKPRHLPRFSLRSLILFVTLAGAGSEFHDGYLEQERLDSLSEKGTITWHR